MISSRYSQVSSITEFTESKDGFVIELTLLESLFDEKNIKHFKF